MKSSSLPGGPFATVLLLGFAVAFVAFACGGGDQSDLLGPPSSPMTTAATGSGAGGGTSTGAGGSNGVDAGGVGCVNSLDCAKQPGEKTVCSIPTGLCVQCLSSRDCEMGQECVGNACISYTRCVSSLDCAASEVCDRANNRCVQCLSDVDCKVTERCVANACRERCSSDKSCTPLGMLCDTGAGYCVSCVAHTDCDANHFCSQGTCALHVCAPSSSRCEGNALAMCSATGSGWSAAVPCPAGQNCLTIGENASCTPLVCQPGTVGCWATEEKVISCSADGHVATVVQDCGAQDQVCVSGACASVVCTAGQRFCMGNEVRACSAKGTSSSVVSTCTSAQFCDAATASCKAQLCAPNQPACNGLLGTTCNANGSGYVAGGTDCSAIARICVQGACQDLLCVPNTNYCQGGNVLHCSADGKSSTPAQTCTSTQFCDSPSGACKTQICAPNQPACSGSIATTCNATGSGYVQAGTDCAAAHQGCVQGACKMLACTPNAYSCQANNVVQCSADGTTQSVWRVCTAAQYCSPAVALCMARVCTPSAQPACDGSVATVCNADGSGFTGARTDCSATGQLCVAGACTSSTVDSVGMPLTAVPPSASSQNLTKVDFYAVTANRTLTNIEVAMDVASSLPLTWVVYESPVQRGAYTPLFQAEITAASGTGFQSSGPINVQLVAGHYYAIGVGWGMAAPTYYWQPNAVFPITVSFGTVVASTTWQGDPPPPDIVTPTPALRNLYPQRLTTKP